MTFKDIFQGEYLTIWEDEDCIYFGFPYSIAVIPKSEWEMVKRDIDKLGDL